MVNREQRRSRPHLWLELNRFLVERGYTVAP
jgi:hypothetical protein